MRPISSGIVAWVVLVASLLVAAKSEAMTTLTAEHAVSEPIFDQSPPGIQGVPAVASSGDFGGDALTYLVVWEDSRGDGFDIRAARYTSDGTLLDPKGFLICSAPGDQRAPGVVALKGDLNLQWNFLVTWEDHRSGIDSDIYAARVSVAGEVLDGPTDSGAIAVCTSPGDQTNPAIGGFERLLDGLALIAWEDQGSSPTSVRACRVRSSGVVLDGPAESGGLVIGGTDTGGAALDPAVAGNRSYDRFLVAYECDDRIFVRFVSSDGVVTHGYVRGAYSPRDPAIASAESHFIIVWVEHLGQYPSGQIRSAIFTYDGGQPEWLGNDSWIQVGDDQNVRPDVAWNGVDYLVAWDDYGGDGICLVQAKRVRPDGEVLDGGLEGTGLRLSGNYSFQPVIAGGSLSIVDHRWFVVWQNTFSDDVVGARVTGAGDVLDDPMSGGNILLTLAPRAQWGGAIASDGTNWLVAWNEAPHVYVGLMDQQGAILGEPILAVANANTSDLSLVWSGSIYLLIWPGHYRGIGPTGSLSEPGPQDLPWVDGCQSMAAAVNGGTTLVVWQDEWRIRATRIGSYGNILDPTGIDVCQHPSSQSSPAVAAGGTGFLVVWEDDRIDATSHVFGSWMSQTLVEHDTIGQPVAVAQNGQRYPAVGYDGTDFVVAWSDWRSGIDPDDGASIYAARVTPSTSDVLDPDGRLVAQPTDRSAWQCAVADGPAGSATIVWTERTPWGTEPDIRARTFSSSAVLGDILDVAVSGDVEEQPRVACSGRVAFLYSREASEIEYGTVRRQFVRFLGTEGTAVDGQDVPPPALKLTTAYPNPFNPAITLRYVLPRDGAVRLEIFDVRGRRIATLVNATQTAGQQEAVWFARGADGSAPSGVYVARLTFGGEEVAEKVTLLK